MVPIGSRDGHPIISIIRIVFSAVLIIIVHNLCAICAKLRLITTLNIGHGKSFRLHLCHIFIIFSIEDSQAIVLHPDKLMRAIIHIKVTSSNMSMTIIRMARICFYRITNRYTIRFNASTMVNIPTSTYKRALICRIIRRRNLIIRRTICIRTRMDQQIFTICRNRRIRMNRYTIRTQHRHNTG